MKQTWVNRHLQDSETRRLFEQERLILAATEHLYEAMEELGLSKADLARELSTSRANVTALLNGSRNMTLRTLADVATVLGCRVELALEPLRAGEYVNAPVRVVRTLQPRVVQSSAPDAGASEAAGGIVGGELVA